MIRWNIHKNIRGYLLELLYCSDVTLMRDELKDIHSQQSWSKRFDIVLSLMESNTTFIRKSISNYIDSNLNTSFNI